MSGNSAGKKSLYQQAYHLLAKHKSPESRRKAFTTIITSDKSSPAFIKACERVFDNNPHFLKKKGTPEYETAKQESFKKKQKARADWALKNGKETRIRSKE